MMVIPGQTLNKLRQYVALRNECNSLATESARSMAVQIANDLLEAGALASKPVQCSLTDDGLKALANIERFNPGGGR